MATSLEEKIRALLETKEVTEDETLLEGTKETIETKGGSKITDEDDGDEDKDQDESEEDEGDEDKDQDESEEDDGDETAVAKDKAKVNEGTDAFGKLTDTSGDTDKGADNSKIEAGKGRKEGSSFKLKDTASADKQEDNGDNAKIQKGKSNADKSAEKLTDSDLGYTDDDANGFKKVDQKTGLAEHMTALFAGEELSEEFQAKAATIFEAAVNQAAADHVAKLEEQYEQELSEAVEKLESDLDVAVEEVKEGLVDNIDGFLNLMVEQWVSDNQVALERGMKLDLVDSFIDGMKTLFKEHYVEVPEEKLDVIGTQAEQIAELAEQVKKLQEENTILVEQVVYAERSDIMEQVGSDLTKTQQEKFASLCEAIEFNDAEEFKQKVETIKESYFPVGRRSESVQEQAEVKIVGDDMTKYVEAIAKNIRF